VRDASSLAEMEGIGTVEVHRKGKKFYGKKVRVEKIGNSQSDGGGEACSGTEEEQKVRTLKGKVEIEMSNAKIDETSCRGQRKRSKKLFSDGNFVLSYLILSVTQIIKSSFLFMGEESYVKCMFSSLDHHLFAEKTFALLFFFLSCEVGNILPLYWSKLCSISPENCISCNGSCICFSFSADICGCEVI
jgi:hypothetical protein